jgi:hypothetical protein
MLPRTLLSIAVFEMINRRQRGLRGITLIVGAGRVRARFVAGRKPSLIAWRRVIKRPGLSPVPALFNDF